MTGTTADAPSLAVAARSIVVPHDGIATVLTADPSRRSCAIVNVGTVSVRISGDLTRDPSAGFLLAVGAGYNWTSQAACYAFTEPGNVTDGGLSTLAETGTAG